MVSNEVNLQDWNQGYAVIPAKAGIQKTAAPCELLGAGLRRPDRDGLPNP